MECGSEASAHAEANASALQTGRRAAPLSHAVGEGLGVRAESGRTLHTVNPSDVPLSALTPTLSPLDKGGEGREWGDSARAGICELWLSDWYYIYDPDAGELYGFVRDESGHLRRVAEMRGWVSPLLGVRFELAGGELVVVRPDGERFVGYEELAAALEEAQARAEQERQRAERLAQRLRELGVEPE
jgi:hypothetical protein